MSSDLLVLKIDGKDLPTVNFPEHLTLNVGDPICTIGNPEGFVNTLSEGIVSSKRSYDNATFFQITAPISHGSSGGPVFDSAGQVVGVASRMIKEGQNINFAISIEEIEKIKMLE